MTRDLYRAAHKAMRRDLFEVSAMLAATDFSVVESVTMLRDRFAGLRASMSHHAEMEDDELHPLARDLELLEVGVVEAEHGVLDAELEALSDRLGDLPVGDTADVWAAAHDLYLRFNRFVADYLMHIDREERELMPALAVAAAPERLIELARADYRGPVEMLVGAMGNMMPLFNLDDRRQIVADIAAVRTVAELEMVADAGKQALGDQEWARLVV